jgi:hypothetical protein
MGVKVTFSISSNNTCILIPSHPMMMLDMEAEIHRNVKHSGLAAKNKVSLR